MNFNLTHKTGEIILTFPQASQLFKQHNISFCCSGNRPIGEILVEKGIDKQSFMESLNQLLESNPIESIDFQAKKSIEDVIEETTRPYHHFVLNLLEELTFFVRKVSVVHGGHQPHLIELHAIYTNLSAHLRKAIDIKEFDIIPILLKDNTNMEKIAHSIKELEVEYQIITEQFKSIQTLTNEFTPPEDACNTYRVSYLKLEALQSVTLANITYEKSIFF